MCRRGTRRDTLSFSRGNHQKYGFLPYFDFIFNTGIDWNEVVPSKFRVIFPTLLGSYPYLNGSKQPIKGRETRARISDRKVRSSALCETILVPYVANVLGPTGTKRYQTKNLKLRRSRDEIILTST
jgi:hypothetical protein